MKKKLIPPQVYDLIFFSFTFVFFFQFYSYHLHYREQFQLFLFSSDYFCHYASFPGGISDYIGNFITQFFFYSSLGALLIAFLLLALQKTFWLTLKNSSSKIIFYPITFIPSLLYFALLCDENYLMGGLIAVILMNAFCVISFHLTKHTKTKWFLFILTPVVYWLAGGLVYFYVLFTILIHSSNSLKNFKQIAILLSLLAEAIAIPFIAKHIIIQYPLIRFFIGVNFYRYPNIISFAAGLISLIIVLTPFLLNLRNKVKKQTFKPVWTPIFFTIILIIGGSFIIKSADFEKEEVMAYDFYARFRQWNKIISMADKKSPDTPLSVSYLNLALAKKGKLGESMFNYYQNGTEGLIPSFTKDFTIPLVGGEIYYHLGFINTSQRYSFEAMESLPLYQKSVRVIKRLVECNLIQGNNTLALKYLSLLKKTFFYKKWANVITKFAGNDKALLSHPEYGWLKSHLSQHDFLFNDENKDTMLGLQLTSNWPDSQMLYEYLMCYCLLNKNLDNFMQYLFLGKNIKYKHLPKSFQEAIAYVMMSPSFKGDKSMLKMISPDIKKQLTKFMQCYKQTNNMKKMKKAYGDTYYYYLLTNN